MPYLVIFFKTRFLTEEEEDEEKEGNVEDGNGKGDRLFPVKRRLDLQRLAEFS